MALSFTTDNTESAMLPRRSVLYMPGANARAMEKAKSLDCDGIIFDLEDAVATDSKDVAREQVSTAVTGGGYGHRELIVRVNGLDTPWGEADVAMAARLPVAGLLFPKLESAAQLKQIEAAVDAAGGGDKALWIMLETPAGILRAQEIATASERLQVLVMGTSDLVKELRAQHTPERHNIAYALQHCVLVARAHGLEILDGVHLDFRNLESLRQVCEAGVAMGFDGKTLIHPSQVEVANDCFGPSLHDVDQARAVLTAWQSAQADGRGVVELDGQLIENLHAAEAERVIAFAEALARRS